MQFNIQRSVRKIHWQIMCRLRCRMSKLLSKLRLLSSQLTMTLTDQIFQVFHTIHLWDDFMQKALIFLCVDAHTVRSTSAHIRRTGREQWVIFRFLHFVEFGFGWFDCIVRCCLWFETAEKDLLLWCCLLGSLWQNQWRMSTYRVFGSEHFHCIGDNHSRVPPFNTGDNRERNNPLVDI